MLVQAPSATPIPPLPPGAGMSSLRPPVTYARRRTLRPSTPHTATHTAARSSSPLEDLSPTRHDVSLSEMSRRMKKRSRQVVSGRQPAAEGDPTQRLAKKLRRPSQLDLRESDHDSLISTVPSTPVNQHDRSFPLDTQQIYDSIFETPYQSHPSDNTVIKSYMEPIASADSLSPIPVARRMLSRTSSRNLKENSGRSSRQELASPFASRPSSRASSPRRASKTPGRRPLHTKSRTLSSSFIDKPLRQESVSVTQVSSLGDETYDSIFSSTASGPVLSSSAHSRSGSIPTMPSHLMDHISPQDWLVPAKALSRSPPSFEDMELDDWAVPHTSFYLGAPAKISTPPRRRRTTVTLNNYRPPVLQGPSDSPTEESMDLTDVVAGAEDETVQHRNDNRPLPGPILSRRRRRTIVHMSSDSIFSSALDFSAYMTEFSPTKVHGVARPASPPHVAPAPSDHAPAFESSPAAPARLSLDPAFSPDLTPAPDSPKPSLSRAYDDTTGALRAAVYAPEFSRSSFDCEAAPLEAPGRQNLGDLLDALNLNERYAGDVEEGHDSGVGLGKTVVAEKPPSNSQASAEIQAPADDNGDPPREDHAVCEGEPPASQTHGRKRGDTIRASDYARPPLLPYESASMARLPDPRAETKKSAAVSGTRRTRSGTVTLANAQSSGRPRATRRGPNLPTIKMRVHAKPLTPQGSDEEDDELLLRRGVHLQDD